MVSEVPSRVPARWVSFGRLVNISSNKVSVVVVLVKNTFSIQVQGICFRHVNCPVCHKLDALVSSKSL